MPRRFSTCPRVRTDAAMGKHRRASAARRYPQRCLLWITGEARGPVRHVGNLPAQRSSGGRFQVGFAVRRLARAGPSRGDRVSRPRRWRPTVATQRSGSCAPGISAAGGSISVETSRPPRPLQVGRGCVRFFRRRRWLGRPRQRARPSRPAVRPRAAGALVWLAVPRRAARVFVERAGRRGRCTCGAIAAFSRRRRWPDRPRQRARSSRPAVRPRVAGACSWLAVPRRSARVFAERAGRRGRCTRGAIAAFSCRRRWRGRPRERARSSRPAVGPRAAGALVWLAVPRRAARVFVERAGRRGRGTRGAIAAFSRRRRWPGRPRQRARPSRPAVRPRAAGACSWLAVPRRWARVFAERAGRRGRCTHGAIAAFSCRRRWRGRPRQRARPSRPAVGPRAAGALVWLAVPRRAARVFAERAGRRGRCTHGAIAASSRRRRRCPAVARWRLAFSRRRGSATLRARGREPQWSRTYDVGCHAKIGAHAARS